MHLVKVSAFALLLTVVACSPYLAPPTETDATIYVLNTIPGRGEESYALLVDDSEVAFLKSRQYTWFYLPPGSYSFEVAGGRELGVKQSALELKLIPGTTRYLVYDEEERYNYLIEYGQEHALGWLQGARFVSNSVRN